MKLLIVSATAGEIQPLREQLTIHFEQIQDHIYVKGDVCVHFLITGVGMFLTGIAMTQYLAKEDFDWVINMGIAGAFNRDLKIGEVVEVVEERFGDLGAQEKNGDFTDVFELKLMSANEFPFEYGSMHRKAYSDFALHLKTVKGLTVNKVHGKTDDILLIKNKYHSDIETMEGAAFFYVCLLQKIPFTQIRAISNYVEPRNRANWDIPTAVRHLNEVVWELVKKCKM